MALKTILLDPISLSLNTKPLFATAPLPGLGQALEAHQPVLFQQENAGRLVEGPRGQATPVATPSHGVHLGAVRGELARLAVTAKQLLHPKHVASRATDNGAPGSH